MRWNNVQCDAATWLAAGQLALKESPQYSNHKQFEKRTGNYRLTNLAGEATVGETNNLRKRAKRLLKAEIAEQQAGQSSPLIQVAYTDFGRKELEECTPTLNQLAQVEGVTWQDLQAQGSALLSQAFEQLEYIRPREWMARQAEATPGVYMVFKQHDLLYIDESENVLNSLNLHSSNTPQSNLRQAIASYELGLELKTAAEVTSSVSNSSPYERTHLSMNENFAVNHYLQGCFVVNLPVKLGRLELVEALQTHYSPKLTIKHRTIT